MGRQAETDCFIPKAFFYQRGDSASNGRLKSPQVIFEMNFLPGKVNSRCVEKCGGFENARYLKASSAVDWSWQQKTGLLYQKSNQHKGF